MSMSEMVDAAIEFAHTTHTTLEMESIEADTFTFWESTSVWGVVSFTFVWLKDVNEWVEVVVANGRKKAWIVEDDTEEVVGKWLRQIPARVEPQDEYTPYY